MNNQHGNKVPFSDMTTTKSKIVQPDLPPLPEPVKNGWIDCEDCDGNGVVGDPIYQGEFQPPEREPCSSCDGSGHWKVPFLTTQQAQDYGDARAAAAVLAERERCRPPVASGTQSKARHPGVQAVEYGDPVSEQFKVIGYLDECDRLVLFENRPYMPEWTAKQRAGGLVKAEKCSYTLIYAKEKPSV